MAETQLASMRLGSVAASLPETDVRRTKPELELIHITDGQSDEILDVVTARHIIENNHRKSLEDTLETFNFRALGDKPYVEHLEKRNRLIIPDEDGSLVEFIIHEAAKYRDTEGLKVAVYGVASYLDLKKARVIQPTSLEGYTASMAVGFALGETEWTPGNIESAGTRTFRIEDHTNPFALLKRIAREFELELNFRVEHDGNRITGRYVDLLERVGEWRGREIEFGRDLIGIRRTEKTENVVTALVGLGPEREDGTRLEVLVEDEDALQRWGRPHPRTGELQHLIEVYEPQSEREDMTESELRQYTRTELDKRINAAVSYETTIADLEHVPGMENKKIRFGDTIKIKDTHFNPPLYVEARVYQLDRSITDQSKKEIKLGDYTEYTEEEVFAIWRQLQREVRQKISAEQLRAYAEPKKIESDTPPPIREHENPIWVDTSQTPHVPHVVIANEWVKMSPTEAIEVGAETPQGAQNKADQAEQNAKEYSEDAGNIMRGIIDVGAVPLRTSVTGARIEWDGANGLVQYDQKGDPVSWLDLSGNAHFENAYLSGEVVSESFSLWSDKVNIDDDGITVQEADFFTKDPASKVVSKITPITNIITDHSFEAVEGGSLLSDGYYEISYSPVWRLVGNPRATETAHGTDHAAYAIFGRQSILINSSNYVYYVQQELEQNTPYTISAFFRRSPDYTPGTPRIRVEVIDDSGAGGPTTVYSQTFTAPSAVPSDGSTVRHAFTFTIPDNFVWQVPGVWVEISILTTNSNRVEVDGVQLVEGEYPTIYEEEGTLWQAFSDTYVGARLNVRSLHMRDASGTNNNISFPAGHMLSNRGDNMTIYFNRSMGDFEIRSHSFESGYRNEFEIRGSDGTFISMPTRENEVTWSGRAAVANNTGRFGFVSSSRRLKLLIEDVKSDPYDLHKVNPRSWYDKKNTEKYAELLHKQTKGEDVSFDDVDYDMVRIPGLVAEEVYDAGLSEFVTFDKNGEVDGVQYDRLWTLLIPISRDHQQWLEKLEQRISALEEAVE